MRRLDVYNVKEEAVVYAAADRYTTEHPEASLVTATMAARMSDDWWRRTDAAPVGCC